MARFLCFAFKGQTSKVLTLRNKDARRRTYMWVLTCRRVCRGRSAIHEENGKEKTIVMFLQTSDLGSFPDKWSGKSEPTLIKDTSLLKAQICLIINPIVLPAHGG